MIFRIKTNSTGGYAAKQPDHIVNHPSGSLFIYDSSHRYYGTIFESIEQAKSFIQECKEWCEIRSINPVDFTSWEVVEMGE